MSKKNDALRDVVADLETELDCTVALIKDLEEELSLQTMEGASISSRLFIAREDLKRTG